MKEDDYFVCFSCGDKVRLKDAIFENEMNLTLGENFKREIILRCPKCGARILLEISNED